MKKLLAILAMTLAIGCATPAGSMKKCKSGQPPTAPSQEEVLKQATLDVEMEAFNAWWKQEEPGVVKLISSAIEYNVKLDLKEVMFSDNFRIGLIHVIMTPKYVKAGSVSLYIVMLKSDGTWVIDNIIADIGTSSGGLGLP